MNLLDYFKRRLASHIQCTSNSYSDFKNAPQKRKRLAIRSTRLERHRNVWVVLRIFVEYDKVTGANNFFDVRNSLIALDKDIEIAKKSIITQDNVITAIRLINLKQYQGQCDTDTSKISVNLFNTIIRTDFEYILDTAYDWLENYWDEQYSHKHGKAKLERLEYYLEYLDKEKTISIYHKHSKIMDRIQILHKKYSHMLSLEHGNAVR